MITTADLLETLRFDPDEGLVDLDRHLARLKASAAALGFTFSRHDAANELQAACFRLRDPARIRMRLARSGALAIAADALPESPADLTATIVLLPIDAEDPRLRHKTSDRAFYDETRAAAGTFEVIFARPDGLLTEGSFTNLFVPDENGRLRTPPLVRGLLPGVLRARLLDEGRAYEADLTAADCATCFLLGNSLRGLISARLA